MSPVFFENQINRLITRFGQKALDPEFVKLAWREVQDMGEPAFQRFCDVMIGSRPVSKPPLLTDFREARLAQEKRRFEDEVRSAASRLKGAPLEMREHLQKTLSKEFGAVESVRDALEIARIRLKTKAANEGEGA